MLLDLPLGAELQGVVDVFLPYEMGQPYKTLISSHRWEHADRCNRFAAGHMQRSIPSNRLFPRHCWRFLITFRFWVCLWKPYPSVHTRMGTSNPYVWTDFLSIGSGREYGYNLMGTLDNPGMSNILAKYCGMRGSISSIHSSIRSTTSSLVSDSLSIPLRTAWTEDDSFSRFLLEPVFKVREPVLKKHV